MAARTIFAQTNDEVVRTRLDPAATMLGRQSPQVEQMLPGAAVDIIPRDMKGSAPPSDNQEDGHDDQAHEGIRFNEAVTKLDVDGIAAPCHEDAVVWRSVSARRILGGVFGGVHEVPAPAHEDAQFLLRR
ncbi:hypothetical protein GCM10026982_21730 [Nocardiopsis aegyptia]